MAPCTGNWSALASATGSSAPAARASCLRNSRSVRWHAAITACAGWFGWPRSSTAALMMKEPQKSSLANRCASASHSPRTEPWRHRRKAQAARRASTASVRTRAQPHRPPAHPCRRIGGRASSASPQPLWRCGRRRPLRSLPRRTTTWPCHESLLEGEPAGSTVDRFRSSAPGRRSRPSAVPSRTRAGRRRVDRSRPGPPWPQSQPPTPLRSALGSRPGVGGRRGRPASWQPRGPCPASPATAPQQSS